ncbi:hypothetical protein QTJ16_004864 [Diplocarpon rosae]|uniref:DUF7707 domain-containing protein n=1 Tax=Diplocarpon rosae TaxID=946125 RepID=A0AAD9SYW0_9HELO|nr:hypothetical protein QTJ16_004864 [Diplocarpon rosae]
MPSIRTSAAVLATAFFSLNVNSQAVYTIDPNSVSLAIRQGWCNSQQSTCPLLCLQLQGDSSTTEANDCDAESLTYDCICGNGLTPNLTEYSQTVPYFTCTEYGSQCVAACNGNSLCQSECREDHPCGAQNPTRVNLSTVTTSSTKPPAGATSGVVYNGLGDAGSTTSPSGAEATGTKSGSEMALDAGRAYGLAVVLAGIFAGFTLILIRLLNLIPVKTADPSALLPQPVTTPNSPMAPSKKEAAHECVSEEALVHLKSYKYSSVDKSLISNYILKHYWNASVELLPLWLAPNMVTLLGFFFILTNVICLVIWMPDLVGPGPSWLYYSFAFGLWMYSTMDNVDGKQARRTGTSSGLGELFDHGIDSLNCTLASLCETAAMGLGTSKAGIFTAIIPCLPMFFSTWETYHTHTLYLGVFNGPTEGLILACTIMILSGYYGPEIWQQRITDLVGHHYFLGYHEFFGTYSVRDLWVPILVVTLFGAHVPFCVINVVKARRRDNLPVLPVFLEWTPMAVFTFSIGAWLYSPYSTLIPDNHLVLFCLTMSFVFGRMTTKIILAHLTRQPFPYWTVMLTPLVGGAVLGNLPRVGLPQVSSSVELWYLRSYFVFAIFVYFRWAFLVINSICSYLGINCLTIPSDKLAANQEKAKAAIGNVKTNGHSNDKRVD